MKHKVNASSPGYLIKSVGECDIWDNCNRKLGFRICIADFDGFILRPNSGDYFVSSLDKNLKNVG
jgi:hypothetical protein